MLQAGLESVSSPHYYGARPWALTALYRDMNFNYFFNLLNSYQISAMTVLDPTSAIEIRGPNLGTLYDGT